MVAKNRLQFAVYELFSLQAGLSHQNTIRIDRNYDCIPGKCTNLPRVLILCRHSSSIGTSLCILRTAKQESGISILANSIWDLRSDADRVRTGSCIGDLLLLQSYRKDHQFKTNVLFTCIDFAERLILGFIFLSAVLLCSIPLRPSSYTRLGHVRVLFFH